MPKVKKYEKNNKDSPTTIIKVINDKYHTLVNFIDKVYYYSKNKVIYQYFQILNVDPRKFSKKMNSDYAIELKKLVKSFFTYPFIFKEICLYVITRNTKLDFLKMFSDEQVKYITNLDVMKTKLIATAGSGKTRSLIGRIKFMVEHGLVKKEEVFMITFSKHAAADFHLKIKDLFPNYETFCQLKNFSTIDSLAKSIL